MTCARLPQELIDDIFDYIYHDQRALKRCSLVCRAWLCPARRQLFSNATLNSRQVANLFKPESCSVVAPFVRRLHITNCPTDFWNETFPSLVGFQAITSLSLTHLPWHEMFSRVQSMFLNRFIAISRLHLQRVDTIAFSHLAQIICDFPCLETLILDYTEWRKSDIASSALALPRHFRALELQSPQIIELLQWLCSFGQRLALRTVCLHDVRRDHCSIINTFLGVLGPSLETFRFHLAGISPPPLSLLYHWSDIKLNRGHMSDRSATQHTPAFCPPGCLAEPPKTHWNCTTLIANHVRSHGRSHSQSCSFRRI